jgi:hypothetical protein
VCGRTHEGVGQNKKFVWKNAGIARSGLAVDAPDAVHTKSVGFSASGSLRILQER